MRVEPFSTEVKSFIHNATIFLLIVLAAVSLYAAFIYLANNLTAIARWCLVAAYSVWLFLKSIPGWLWITLAILRVGRMITAALSEIASRLTATQEDRDDLVVPMRAKI